MAHDPPGPQPLQPSHEGHAEGPAETSSQPSPSLTLKQAARQAGCSESTLRRLVKAGEVPFTQEETKTGFRYMFEASVLPVIAHKAAMRRPSGRPSVGRVGGGALQASTNVASQEASIAREELAAIRAERDLLKAENARLWAQIERLTESVTRLALPPSRRPEDEGLEGSDQAEKPPRRTFWDYFFGR
jgi:excisionase family DNA binding protein